MQPFDLALWCMTFYDMPKNTLDIFIVVKLV